MERRNASVRTAEGRENARRIMRDLVSERPNTTNTEIMRALREQLGWAPGAARFAAIRREVQPGWQPRHHNRYTVNTDKAPLQHAAHAAHAPRTDLQVRTPFEDLLTRLVEIMKIDGITRMTLTDAGQITVERREEYNL